MLKPDYFAPGSTHTLRVAVVAPHDPVRGIGDFPYLIHLHGAETTSTLKDFLEVAQAELTYTVPADLDPKTLTKQQLLAEEAALAEDTARRRRKLGAAWARYFSQGGMTCTSSQTLMESPFFALGCAHLGRCLLLSCPRRVG